MSPHEEKIVGLLMNSSRTVTLADTVHGVTDIDKTLSSFPIKPNLAANPLGAHQKQPSLIHWWTSFASRKTGRKGGGSTEERP